MNSVNVLKCRKSAVTVLYVYGLLLIFYLPFRFFATLFAEALFGYTIKVKTAYNYTRTVVFIYSCLNPVLYCWRIKEIRRAVKNTLKNKLRKYQGGAP